MLITSARHHLRISTAYFMPDKHTLSMLCDCARRGVQVDLLVNGPHTDKWISRLATQGQYEPLLDAGVNVWCYQPTMLHQKMMSLDGIAATVGSANFNSRSLLHDEELNLSVFDPMVVSVLDAAFDADLDRAERVDARLWARRSRLQQVGEFVPAVLARHL
ncbi:MAG: phospholipase D-like domain-containing protein [Acidimicrobiales bacterium]